MVSIIMGSDSDLPVMQKAADVLSDLEVPFEMTIVSAHRTPERMFQFAKNAHVRGIRVITIDGWDSILSILQMPEGVPVATVALNAARNAGILAAQMLATSDPALLDRIVAFKKLLEMKVLEKAKGMEGGE